MPRSLEAGTETSDPSPAAPPTVLLSNEDDTTHRLDVRIADDEAVLSEARHTVAGDSQRAVAAGTDGRTLRVDLRADHGASASLTLDPRRSAVPEFVVRRETIVVAGVN